MHFVDSLTQRHQMIWYSISAVMDEDDNRGCGCGTDQLITALPVAPSALVDSSSSGRKVIVALICVTRAAALCDVVRVPLPISEDPCFCLDFFRGGRSDGDFESDGGGWAEPQQRDHIRHQ